MAEKDSQNFRMIIIIDKLELVNLVPIRAIKVIKLNLFFDVTFKKYKRRSYGYRAPESRSRGLTENNGLKEWQDRTRV